MSCSSSRFSSRSGCRSRAFLSSALVLADSLDILNQLEARQQSPNAANDPAGAVPAGSPFLGGETITVAGATLLQRVASAITRFGGSVQSSQVDLQGPQSKDGFVTLVISCEMEQPNLQKLLYDLEAGMPFLFIDQLVVQGPQTSAVRGRRSHADIDRGIGSVEGHKMIVRHVLLRAVCGLCVIGAMQLVGAGGDVDRTIRRKSTSIVAPSIWTKLRRRPRPSARRSAIRFGLFRSARSPLRATVRSLRHRGVRRRRPWSRCRALSSRKLLLVRPSPSTRTSR